MMPPTSTTRAATIRRRRARRSGERRGVRAPPSRGEGGLVILSEGQINAIVDRVVRQLSPELREVPQSPAPPAVPAADERVRPAAPARASSRAGSEGVFDDLEAA